MLTMCLLMIVALRLLRTRPFSRVEKEGPFDLVSVSAPHSAEIMESGVQRATYLLDVTLKARDALGMLGETEVSRSIRSLISCSACSSAAGAAIG